MAEVLVRAEDAGLKRSFDELRAREFSRLDAQRHVYLDYTGSALYADSQIRAHHGSLREGLFGNPHSAVRRLARQPDVIDRARRRVLRFFDVDASRTTSSSPPTPPRIKLVAESYPFAPARAASSRSTTTIP